MGKAHSFLRQQRVQEALSRASSLAERLHLREAASKAQSFLRQPRVREAVGRVSSLAEQLHLRETLGKVPPPVRRWRLPERLGRPKHRDAIVDLDMLMARGAELQRAPNGGDDERWRSDALAWLAAGEALLRERLPEEFYRLGAFAARLALDADQDRLRQVVSGRLAVLADIRRRRGVHTPAG